MIIYLVFPLIILIIFLALSFKLHNSKYNPYKKQILYLIEFFWLIIAFFGVMVGLMELSKFKKELDYNIKEKEILGRYYELRSTISGKTMVMKIDSTIAENVKESIRWFYKIKYLFEEGYQSKKWKRFLFYTRGFVFEERGVIIDFKEEAELFDWPQNRKLISRDLHLKDEIRSITDLLVDFDKMINDFELNKPEKNNSIGLKVVFALIFILGLSQKLIKVYIDFKNNN